MMTKNRSEFYSKQNPFGPYGNCERPLGNQGADFIEGFSTKENLAQWSARAEQESMQRSKPTGDLHLREPSKQGHQRDPRDMPRDPERLPSKPQEQQRSFRTVPRERR